MNVKLYYEHSLFESVSPSLSERGGWCHSCRRGSEVLL